MPGPVTRHPPVVRRGEPDRCSAPASARTVASGTSPPGSACTAPLVGPVAGSRPVSLTCAQPGTPGGAGDGIIGWGVFGAPVAGDGVAELARGSFCGGGPAPPAGRWARPARPRPVSGAAAVPHAGPWGVRALGTRPGPAPSG